MLKDFSKLCKTSQESVMSYFCKQSKVPRKGDVMFVVSMVKLFLGTDMKRKQHVVVKCYYYYIFTNEHRYLIQT